MSWQRVRSEFEALLECSHDQRETRLRELEATDRWLAEQLREMFQHDSGAGGFLERARAVGPVVAAGGRVGRYRLVGPIGAGGMGAVWSAEQDEPRRQVALKLLAQSARTQAERWRFTHEVRVLAKLNHPAIATFYDAGVDTLGGMEVAWLAMELVEDAVDLLAWASSRELPRLACLQLFARLCDAVAYGHRHGVLHRDLKPSNVLVGRDGQLKLIDFGVARALDEDAAGANTRTGDVVGTLQYMAPEQMRGEVAAIGTACDVYALGGILYHLLCGRAPFDFAGRSFADIARLVLEQEPVPVRIACPDLPADLGWIVMKALEKDPARRYPTVEALVADLECFRAHRPVAAGPASLGYRLRKYVRRHRVAALVTAAVAAGLAIGAVGLWRGEEQAREGERLALLGKQEAEKGERAARRASDFSREVLRVTVGLFDAIDETDRNRDLTVHELLAASTIDGQATTDAGIEQAVRQVRGNAYLRLGRYPEARREYERAAALQEAAVRAVVGTPDEASARANAHELSVLLGRTLVRTGERERGDAMLRDAVDAAKATEAGVSDGMWTRILQQFCRHLADENAHAELLQVATELREGAERAGAAFARIEADRWIAGAASALQRFDEAKAAAERAWRGAQQSFGDRHKHTCAAMGAYVTMLQESGDLDAAERLYPELVASVSEIFGAGHPHTLVTLNNRAHLLLSRGKKEQAVAAMREVVAAHEARGGAMTPEHLQAKHNLGMLLNQSGRFAEAEPLLRATAEASRQLLGPDNPEGMMMRFNHGACLAWSKRLAEAEPVLLAEYEALAALLPPAHTILSRARKTIADAYAHNGRPADAERWRGK